MSGLLHACAAGCTVTGQLEQSYNEGSFVAVSGDDPIVVNPFGYVVQENGDFGAMMDFDRDFDSDKPGSGERKIANIFVIPRTANQRKGQWQFTNTNTHIERYEDTGTFVRGRAANLGEMYEPTASSGPSRVSLWTRDMVYVRPGLFARSPSLPVPRVGPDQLSGSLDRGQGLSDRGVRHGL